MTIDIHAPVQHDDLPGPGRVAAPGRTLMDVLDATTLATPDAVALDAGDARLSYVELGDATAALAARLRDAGIGPGERVGVRIAGGTADLYLAILAVLRAGAAYVPVDADDPDARAEDIWHQADVCAVLTGGLELRMRRPARGVVGAPGPDDDAWVIFTSGSTGRPKGVAISHRSAAAFVDAETRLWTVAPDDRVLAGLSVGFDASCEEMWLAWRNGAALVPAPRSVVRSGADLGPWLVDRDVSVVSTVPTLAAMWDDAALSGVRLLILGGEALPQELGERLARGREVWNTYGPTEATVVTTAARVRPGEPVTIGRPLAGWEVAVVDEQLRPVAPGEPGELVIGGVGLGRYLDARLDAERFPALPLLGWERGYRSGDVVRETPAGLAFVGRRDDQVKLGGRRLELGEIDAALHEIAGVRSGAAAVRTTAAGNPVLVAYVTGDVAPADVVDALSERLPAGVRPLVVMLDELPVRSSGKIDRAALPWPPPAPEAATALDGTAQWLAQAWADQLGPLTLTPESDFFALGGTSLAVAKLVSALRARVPSVAVADVYRHRRLGELAARLDTLAAPEEDVRRAVASDHRDGRVRHLAAMLGVLAAMTPAWLVALFALGDLAGGGRLPHVPWPAIGATWVLLVSSPGRALVAAVAGRVLLADLRPGRYPRRGSLGVRVWLVEQLAELLHLDSLAGTPWATRYARLAGCRVSRSARLGTIPSPTALVTIGAGATLEGQVDARGWWIDGDELVVGDITIGAGARVGARTLLMPGAVVGARAEVDAGSVVCGHVPAGERWGGSPAGHIGRAGDEWPAIPGPEPRHPRLWRAMFAVGLALQSALPALAAAPGLVAVAVLAPRAGDLLVSPVSLVAVAPLYATTFVLAYAVLTALAIRAVSRLVVAGWHPELGPVGWALWFTEGVLGAARGLLFPLFSSLYVHPWLRLAGIEVGRRAEVSTAVGLNRLVTIGERAFVADDVVFGVGRARDGWLHVAPIEVGAGTFLGNGAMLRGGTVLGPDSLVGVLSTAPLRPAPATSWLGMPPLELPRVADTPDPARTVAPPRRLVVARAALELVRILLPAIGSAVLGELVFAALWAVGRTTGSIAAETLATPVTLLAAGVAAVAFTVLAKWVLIGRYRRGEHPLWSSFVWRDEIVNSLQERLAGAWLVDIALGTPLMNVYLRAMGTRVGTGVWCDTLTITEFDLVALGDGCAVNRHACVETHLFHDRLMRIGANAIGPGATLGPYTAMLPDTVVGAGCSVGGRSVVLRGERLPAHTRWHGAPVVRA